MKRRIFSVITALALCLGLLPGTALAEETGAVTITGPAEDAQPVTLEAEKFYVINTSDDVGGVTVQETAPTDKAYLTYADRTLTVCGKEGNTVPIEIFGKMALSADLKMVFDSNAQASGRLILSWNGDSGPALALNGHTLTLEKDMSVTIQASEGNKPAVDGGTIRFAAKTRDNVISLFSTGANAASGNLTVENAEEVIIRGKSPVFEHLTVENCGSVIIGGQGLAAPDAAQKITSSVPLMLMVNPSTGGPDDQLIMMPDHTVWAMGNTDITSTVLGSLPATPTAYKAGEGWVFCELQEDGSTKVILDNAQCPNGGIAPDSAVSIEVKGRNYMSLIMAEGSVTVNENGGTLNALVCEMSSEKNDYTVYGEVELGGQTLLGQVPVGEETMVSSLTIPQGAKLTIPKMIDGRKGPGLIIFDLGEAYLRNEGTIVNNGTVALTGAAAESANAQTVKSLKLTGDTGKVMVEKTVEGSKVMETYTNGGLKLFPPAGQNGTLNLSNVSTTDENHWNDQGYKWEVLETEAGTGKILKAKLTLAEGFNATQVTLPDATVEIVTQGECTIGTLSPYYAVSPDNTHADKTKLTFSGAGPLTITERINIAGGDYNTLTVNQNANVIANGGIFIGTSGGSNSIITVNGNLTATADTGTVIHAGSVAICNTGVLNVSGADGVLLSGMPKNTNAQYNNLFSVTGNGRFSAECSNYNIKVESTNSSDFPKDSEGKTDPRAVINLRADYWPENCEPKLNGTAIDLWNTAKDDVYKGKMTIHQNHTYPSAWEKNASEHWKECTYEGCGKRSQVGAHVYDGDWDATCNTCGYRRSTSHTHSFGDWTYDADNHWKQCVCGERTQTGAHVFDGDQDLVCNTCGYNRGAAHTHGWATEWSHDETHHWHECTVAGCDVTSNSQKEGYGPHAYDNDQDTGCNICGYERTVAPSRPSGGGGGSSVSTYAVTVEKSEHGKVTSNRTNASSGSTVTLTVTPDPGYVLDALTVTDSRDNTVAWQDKGDGKYTFTMPSRAVTVKSTFAPLPDDRSKPCDGGADCPSRGFTDLGTVGTWYHEAVDYVLRNNLMAGYGNGKFGPNDNLSRAQFVQILFNKEGRPVVNYLLRYRDVADGAWYTEAVRWATSQGIVHGYGNGMFGPNDNITREQLAVMLWRYSGSPAATDTELNFTDADKASGYAREALRWAVENGIIRGYGNGLLAPQGLATRAQAAQMLMNLLVTSTAVPFGQYAPRTARAA